MSGGHFDYIDSRCKDEIFGWADKPKNVFEDREISALIWDVFDLIHAYDWYASGDTCEASYLNAKAAFKEKWLKRDEERVQMIIDDAIEEVRLELYKTYGVERTERNE